MKALWDYYNCRLDVETGRYKHVDMRYSIPTSPLPANFFAAEPLPPVGHEDHDHYLTMYTGFEIGVRAATGHWQIKLFDISMALQRDIRKAETVEDRCYVSGFNDGVRWLQKALSSEMTNTSMTLYAVPDNPWYGMSMG